MSNQEDNYKPDRYEPEPDEKQELLEELRQLGDAYSIKKRLSEYLFSKEGYHEAIVGVGVGEIDGKECVRIYIDDRRTGETKEMLKAFVKSDTEIPKELPGTLPPDLLNGVIVELVSAPRPGLSSHDQFYLKIPFIKKAICISIGLKKIGDKCSCCCPPTRKVTSTFTPPRPADPWVPPCNAAGEFTSLPAGTSVWSKPNSKGTIGYFYTDGSGDKYLLSCNHVLTDLAAESTIKPDTPIYRNGSGSNTLPIATLSAVEPLIPFDLESATDVRNTVDAALAKITMGVQDRILKGPTLTGQEEAKVGMAVKKHGIGTCLTDGVIDDVSCDMRVAGPGGKSYLFVEQIRVRPANGSKRFAARGDSGSMVFHKSNAVGLLFAIGDSKSKLGNLDLSADRTVDFAIVNPIDTVMKSIIQRLQEAPSSSRFTLDYFRRAT